MNITRLILLLLCFLIPNKAYAMKSNDLKKNITILENKTGKKISLVRQKQISINLSKDDIQDIEQNGLAIYSPHVKNSLEHTNLTYTLFAKDNHQTECAYLLYLLVESKQSNNLVHLQEDWPYYTRLVEQLKRHGFRQTQPIEKSFKQKLENASMLDTITKYVMICATLVVGIGTFRLQLKKRK